VTSRTDYNNPQATGSLALPYHYEMVSDRRRVGPFREAIERVCAGKVVLESGTGSAILSLLAARAGATAVYTFDLDPAVAAVAEENIRRSGLSDLVHFAVKNTLDVTLADLGGRRPDVVIAENLSTWQVTEPQITVLNHINTELATEFTVRLPTRVFNTIELAESQYVFEDIVSVRTHYFEFTGVPTPTLLSEPRSMIEVDLRRVNPTTFRLSAAIEVRQAGVLNSLRLTSPLEVFDGIMFTGSDSLMPPVVVPLPTDLPVGPGDRVEVEVAYETNTGWDGFHRSARRLP
jgi:predicted RNA methylase